MIIKLLNIELERETKMHVFWHCHKIGQGHPRVIICANYDGLESPMLHTKFRGNQPAGSGEEDF